MNAKQHHSDSVSIKDWIIVKPFQWTDRSLDLRHILVVLNPIIFDADLMPLHVTRLLLIPSRTISKPNSKTKIKTQRRQLNTFTVQRKTTLGNIIESSGNLLPVTQNRQFCIAIRLHESF